MTDLENTSATVPCEEESQDRSRKLLLIVAGSGLVAAKLLYIVVELYYNNSLQIFGSSPGITADDIERFHTFGRHVAAIGATLLIGGLFLRRNAKRVRAGIGRPRWRLLGGMAVGVYLTALALQTVAINLMIDFSSDRTAYRAYAGGMAQTLILSGVGESFGLGASIDRYDMAVDDSETMLSLLPVASIGTDSYADRLAGNRDAIAAALRAQIFHTRLSDDLGRFHSAQRELVALWNAMNDASRAIRDRFRSARRAILEPRDEAFDELVSRYKEYRYAQARYERAIPRMSRAQRVATQRNFDARAGLPPTLSPREFFSHPEVREQSGLWSSGDEPAAMDIVEESKRLANKRDQMIEQAVSDLSEKLPPELAPYIAFDRSFAEFLELPPVRERIESLIDPDKGIDLGESGRTFFEDVWAPRVSREVDDVADQYVLESPADIAKPGMQELRTNALKAAYVMPLALCLSTVFLLLNVLTILRWRRLSRRGRIRTRSFIGLVLLISAMSPLDGNGTLDEAFDLPVGVEQIARTTRVINGFGSFLTHIVPPTWFGLVPESVCTERRSIYEESDGSFFDCFRF